MVYTPYKPQTIYSIKNREFPSKWWEGETLKDTYSYDVETTLIEEAQTPKIILASAFDGQCLYYIRPEDLAAFFKTQKHPFIVHNSAFELETTAKEIGDKNFLFKMIDAGLVYDTYILARLISLAKKGEALNSKGRFGLQTQVSKLGIELPKEVDMKGKLYVYPTVT